MLEAFSGRYSLYHEVKNIFDTVKIWIHNDPICPLKRGQEFGGRWMSINTSLLMNAM